MKLFAIGNNAKTVKSDKGGEYLTAIMYMRPNLRICAMSALAMCHDPCLNTAGRGGFNKTQAARQRKTDAYEADPIAFVDQLKRDVREGIRKANKLRVKLAVRPNGTSDIPWENMPGSNGLTLIEEFPEVQFYDYTKLPGRRVPDNYHLTVSYSGANPKYAAKVLASKHNIAVVFRDSWSIPEFWNGRPVINGDQHDLRFKDPTGVVVALTAKGKAKKDTSGFVVDVSPQALAVQP
ncbi:MAG: Mesorhizobium phage vB MloP Lo5R7ANS [Pseudomonadota bacterium]|jgi:hypothetical protein